MNERIAKIMSRRGFCSRRDAEKLIAEGKVYVNGVLIETPGTKVSMADDITVAGDKVAAAESLKMWAFYKPKECLTTHYDPQGRTTLFSLLPREMQRVISVGRLDYNTEGLILLCNDGETTRQLELPKSRIPRVYKCRVFGRIPSVMVKMMAEGLHIDGVHYAPIKCWIEADQGLNSWLVMELHEGKNREIRRICEYFDLQVSRLIRVQYGSVSLGDMEPGEGRRLSSEQLDELLGMVAL